MRHAVVAVVAFMLLTSTASADPSQALVEGRALIAKGDCAAAIPVLANAFAPARAIADANTQANALAALHFYSAVAYSDCRNAESAREELREFFRLKPGQNSLDPAKFSKAFLRLFDEVQRANNAAESEGASFERFYGAVGGGAMPAPLRLPLWGSSSEFILFGDDVEKEEWGRLQDDVARAAFVERFWSRRHPREELLHRIAFADRTFDGDRGSLSDRGRVFVLLGKPARVHRRAIRRYATSLHMRSPRDAAAGVLERWVYFKPQLPEGVPASEVVFSFITDEAGEALLQRDFLPLKTLSEAKRTAASAAE